MKIIYTTPRDVTVAPDAGTWTQNDTDNSLRAPLGTRLPQPRRSRLSSNTIGSVLAGKDRMPGRRSARRAVLVMLAVHKFPREARAVLASGGRTP